MMSNFVKKIIRIISYLSMFFSRKIDADVKNERLFEGADDLFKEILLKNTKVYAEYGCGDSTEWVAQRTNVKIYSVDTSREWIRKVQSCNNRLNSNNVKFIDCGSVGDWGTPVDCSKRDGLVNYTDWIWQQKLSPDTILIDGRFRVCCFLTCLKNAKQGTQIIFDDYVDRPYYHIVEEFITREDTNGRQCLFIVPKKSEINIDRINYEIEHFRYVMD
jgi:hypothetical protein